MLIRVPLILTRAEFEKIAKVFEDSSVQLSSFDVLSDVKAIYFDSDIARAELK